MHDGQVLFAGGTTGTFPGKVHVQADATLFDPATATATSTGSMSIARAFRPLTILLNGQVLAAGGETQNNVGEFSITATAEPYTPNPARRPQGRTQPVPGTGTSPDVRARPKGGEP